MKFVVLNGSPKGDNSTTYNYVKYIERHFPEHSFEYIHISTNTRTVPCKADEVHRSFYGKSRAVFENFLGYKLGLTATPKDYMKFTSELN